MKPKRDISRAAARVVSTDELGKRDSVCKNGSVSRFLLSVGYRRNHMREEEWSLLNATRAMPDANPEGAEPDTF